ncbi:MAG TPA: helix-turn-helix transcriptional regulator, partial [Acinetobacter pseudolwoffii]|nr:helix-turn-helix transcriptional regulator [Acinetobacter pseudolwoffii]
MFYNWWKVFGLNFKISKVLGYTQKSLSEKTKVNKTTISEIENG